MSNIVVGANAPDVHYVNANAGRDFGVDHYLDVRMVSEADPCARCGKPLRIVRGIEVGHVFKLGTKYSASMDATYLDADGSSTPNRHGLLRHRRRPHGGGGCRAAS